jgi:prepilin-type N-terminal cleavage/methylation domain-containing protein
MGSPVTATSRPRVCGVFNPRRTIAIRPRSEGFSLLEMAIVLSLFLVAAAIALVLVKNVVRSVHLRQTASNYANLLQQARVRAVQDDMYYSVITSNSSSVCTSGVTPCAFIDLNGNGIYDNGEPMLAFRADVKPMSASLAPSVDNLKAQFLPSATTWVTIDTTAPGPTFGPRGIPCSPTAVSGYTTCPFTQPTSFMTFMKNVRSQNWEAITVTPAARIHLWSYNGTAWSPLN